MEWNDNSYLKAYDHNYCVAYDAGLSHLGEGGSPQSGLQWLKELLLNTGLPARGTRLVDLGCGDGTNGLFLAEQGYAYTGIDLSLAAVKRAQKRAVESNIRADFIVGDVLDLPMFSGKTFSIVLDSYCFHMLVIDAHRETYFKNVKRLLMDDGFFLLLAQHDDHAYEGPISSFDEFCRLTQANPSGIPFQKCVKDQWVNVEGKKIYLMGRARSLKGYYQEIDQAGFRVVYHSLWQDRKKVAFLLQKYS